MLKYKKNDQAIILSFCANKELKLIRGSYFEFQ